jgi:hypothetical protein
MIIITSIITMIKTELGYTWGVRSIDIREKGDEESTNP